VYEFSVARSFFVTPAFSRMMSWSRRRLSAALAFGLLPITSAACEKSSLHRPVTSGGKGLDPNFGQASVRKTSWFRQADASERSTRHTPDKPLPKAAKSREHAAKAAAPQGRSRIPSSRLLQLCNAGISCARLKPFELAAIALVATELPQRRLRSTAWTDRMQRVVESLSLRLLDGLAIPTDRLLGH
jgi:hypothetical protein